VHDLNRKYALYKVLFVLSKLQRKRRKEEVGLKRKREREGGVGGGSFSFGSYFIQFVNQIIIIFNFDLDNETPNLISV
jgi:hypothetical protein